jgi:hypothetical protein
MSVYIVFVIISPGVAPVVGSYVTTYLDWRVRIAYFFIYLIT